MLDLQWARKDINICRKDKTLGLKFEAQLAVLSTPLSFSNIFWQLRLQILDLSDCDSHICHCEEEMLENTNLYSHQVISITGTENNSNSCLKSNNYKTKFIWFWFSLLCFYLAYKDLRKTLLYMFLVNCSADIES